MEIFNNLGQKERVIFDGKAATSPVRLRWNVKDSGGQRVAAGIYFVKVTCNEGIFVKKIVVD